MEIKEIPDIPEIQERFIKCVNELRDQVLPSIDKFGPTVFINCYLYLLIESTTFTLKTKEEFEHNTKILCEIIEKNSLNFFNFLKEGNNE